MNYAVILAGGKGLRIGGKTPKQFIDLNGEPMIVRTIRAFNDVEEIDGICVVCLIDYLNLLNDLVKKYSLNKVKYVCFGGDSRQESVRNSLITLKNNGVKDDDIVLIHDCARPFVSSQIILDNIKECKKSGAIVTAIRSTDSLLISKKGGEVDSYLDRSTVYNCQTPQTFKFSIIYEAHKDATDNKIFDSTDDASLVIRMNKKVSIVLGDSSNKKITYKEDLK